MSIIILYDSYFGNTQKITFAIAKTLDVHVSVKLLKAGEATLDDLKGMDSLIVGSPTRAVMPTEKITQFLDMMPQGYLEGIKVAVFDTRINATGSKPGTPQYLIKTLGYAAGPIAQKLQKKGGELIAAPKGFYVQDIQGPLKEGEIERAKRWAKGLLKKLHQGKIFKVE